MADPAEEGADFEDIDEKAYMRLQSHFPNANWEGQSQGQHRNWTKQ